MYATEYEITVNEPFIKILEYEKLKGKNVKVIILVEDDNKKDLTKDSFDFIERYTKNPINFPKNFKFDREEANGTLMKIVNSE